MTANPDSRLHDLSVDDAVFIVDTYLSDTALHLDAMKGALERHDLRLLARAARWLKLASRRVNAVDVARLARDVLHLANEFERQSRLAGDSRSLPVHTERDLTDLMARLAREHYSVCETLAGYLYERVAAPDPDHTDAARGKGVSALMQRLLQSQPTGMA